MIASQSRDVDIIATVVVIIADGYAEAVDIDIEPAAFCNVGEGAVVIVAVKRGRCSASMRNQILAVDQEDIQPAISIRVEKCRSRTHCFGQPFLTAAASVMREVNAGTCRDICEADRLGGVR